MFFDADAYAEGICNSAAGSSIEALVDALDATIVELQSIEGDEITDVMADLTGDPQPKELAALWSELRDAIVERERATDEDTTFNERNEDL